MPLHVILVNPEIPPNTGNIARLCGATGSPLHLVHPLGFSTDAKALRRAGLDYWSEVEVHHHDSAQEAFAAAGTGPLILLSARAERPYTEAPFADGARLVFGAETTGLPAELLAAHPDKVYRIPIWGKVRSLNLSTAAGIVVYEGYRRLGAWQERPPPAPSPETPPQSAAMRDFRPAGTLPGRLFTPRTHGAKKHPCKDCYACAWCSDSRCHSCRQGK